MSNMPINNSIIFRKNTNIKKGSSPLTDPIDNFNIIKFSNDINYNLTSGSNERDARPGPRNCYE